MKCARMPALFSLVVLACGGSANYQPPQQDSGLADSGVRDGEPAGCIDGDGDGAGIGADCASQDCDDADPLTTDQCGTGCDERPERLGCPCSFEQPALCFHGPADANGRGTCRPGLQECIEGLRGPCEGQVLPRVEQCDEQDDDCDGAIDEGVTNECGTCGDCREGACFGVGADCTAWSAGRLDYAIEVGDTLTLVRLADEDRVVWPTHYGTCVAYKVEPATHEIHGGYLTSDERVHIAATAVDREGNLVLAHSRGSWVTRISRDEAACPDRNGNGVVDTSHAADEILSFDEPDAWEDECILWHTQVPAGARAIALHESYGLDRLVERVWVGIDDDDGVDLDSGFIELDLDTGEATGRTVATPGFGPLGSAVDDRGRIWATANTSDLGVFDPAAPDPAIEFHAADSPLKAVAIDQEGLPWVTGSGLRRFDPATGVFESVYEDWELEQGLVPSTGSLATDGEGSIWEVHDQPFVYRIDTATFEWGTLDFGAQFPYFPSNLGVDFMRQLWVMVVFEPGAWVYDLSTEESTLALGDCGEDTCENATAHGDFTGLAWAAVQPERGVWTDDLVACEEGDEAVWTSLRATSAIPSGSRVSIMVRTGANDADLWEGAWLPVGELADGASDLPLDTVLGEETRAHRAFAVQARLEANRGADSPIVSSIEVSWGCQRVQ